MTHEEDVVETADWNVPEAWRTAAAPDVHACSHEDVHLGIISTACEAVGMDRGQGGVIVVTQGFFVYEVDAEGCVGLVAPQVNDNEALTEFFCRLWVPGHAPERYPHRGNLRGDVAVLLQGGPAEPARPVLDRSGLTSFSWIPRWSDYMAMPPLARTWRTSMAGHLRFDMPMRGGLVAALPDHYTGDKVIEHDQSRPSAPDPHRITSVASYVLPGTPDVEVTIAGVSARLPIVRGKWTVLAVTHRHTIVGDPGAIDRVTAAHDAAIVRMHPAGTPAPQRPQHHEHRLPMQPRTPTLDILLDGLESVVPRITVPGTLGCGKGSHAVEP